jgi:hypothetical protein
MKLKINPTEEDAMLTLIDGPVWPDDYCNHGKDCFITSFEVANHNTHTIDKYDLYLFPDKFHGQEVCIRYGKEDNEYISPGGLLQFLGYQQSPQHEPNYTACQILRRYGNATWTPNETIKNMKYAYIPCTVTRNWKSSEFTAAEKLIVEKGALSKIGNIHSLGLLFQWPGNCSLPEWAIWLPS